MRSLKFKDRVIVEAKMTISKLIKRVAVGSLTIADFLMFYCDLLEPIKRTIIDEVRGTISSIEEHPPVEGASSFDEITESLRFLLNSELFVEHLGYIPYKKSPNPLRLLDSDNDKAYHYPMYIRELDIDKIIYEPTANLKELLNKLERIQPKTKDKKNDPQQSERSIKNGFQYDDLFENQEDADKFDSYITHNRPKTYDEASFVFVQIFKRNWVEVKHYMEHKKFAEWLYHNSLIDDDILDQVKKRGLECSKKTKNKKEYKVENDERLNEFDHYFSEQSEQSERPIYTGSSFIS